MAPANVTLTAIRAAIDERRSKLTAIRALRRRRVPTEVIATARQEIATAHLTLTAIRATLECAPATDCCEPVAERQDRQTLPRRRQS